eukprot:scaffold90114_cov31-Attheya_sp.AAC.1
MDENKHPVKMLPCWCPEPRPFQCPKIAIQNSLIKALQRVDPKLSPKGILSEFWEQAKDPTLLNEPKNVQIDDTRNKTFFPQIRRKNAQDYNESPPSPISPFEIMVTFTSGPTTTHCPFVQPPYKWKYFSKSPFQTFE